MEGFLTRGWGRILLRCRYWGFHTVFKSWKAFWTREWLVFVPGFAMEGVPSPGTPGAVKGPKPIHNSSS